MPLGHLIRHDWLLDIWKNYSTRGSPIYLNSCPIILHYVSTPQVYCSLSRKIQYLICLDLCVLVLGKLRTKRRTSDKNLELTFKQNLEAAVACLLLKMYQKKIWGKNPNLKARKGGGHGALLFAHSDVLFLSVLVLLYSLLK